MKHEKEWYTCDRCGSEIKMLPEKRTLIRRILMTPARFKMEYAETTGYIADTELISPGIMAVQIIETCDVRDKDFHLCPKCRKEFEEWMKNERHNIVHQ